MVCGTPGSDEAYPDIGGLKLGGGKHSTIEDSLTTQIGATALTGRDFHP
jgi:hypothetical protein